MKRREFLQSIVAAGGASLVQAAPAPLVMTVRGSVNAGRLGTTLMHEHIMVDFIGAARVSRDRYVASEVIAAAQPHLQRARQLGCRTFVDCTPAWLGRDVSILKTLSEKTGLNILTNTGYYGARKHMFVPAHAETETAEQLAARWIREFEQGIDGTGIRPGIIKIGVDGGPLSEINQKLVTAAALTHLRTGLTIGGHTGDGVAAMQQLDILERNGVHPAAFIWIHAQSEKDPEIHRQAARRGCWVEFDGIGPSSIDRHLELVGQMEKAGYLSRVLLSMDAGWYHIGEPGGGNYRGYESIFTEFLPRLRRQLSNRQVDRLLIANPAAALTLRVRPRPWPR